MAWAKPACPRASNLMWWQSGEKFTLLNRRHCNNLKQFLAHSVDKQALYYLTRRDSWLCPRDNHHGARSTSVTYSAAACLGWKTIKCANAPDNLKYSWAMRTTQKNQKYSWARRTAQKNKTQNVSKHLPHVSNRWMPLNLSRRIVLLGSYTCCMCVCIICKYVLLVIYM